MPKKNERIHFTINDREKKKVEDIRDEMDESLSFTMRYLLRLGMEVHNAKKVK